MHFLRDSLSSPEDLARASIHFQQGLQALQVLQGEERIRVLGQLGSLARQLGHFEQASQLFQEAIALATRFGRPRLEVLNRIRLAVNQQYAGLPEAAEKLLLEVLEQVSTTPQAESYRDFVFYHLGKLYAEAGQLHQALKLFETALILRQQKRDTDLIENTEVAIAVARHWLEMLEKAQGDDPYAPY